MEYNCPKGHISTDADYCSDCGTKIGVSALPKSDNAGQVASTQATCPVCSTSRVVDSRFCEVCRYDFETKTSSVAETVLATQQAQVPSDESASDLDVISTSIGNLSVASEQTMLKSTGMMRLDVIITVDKDKVPQDVTSYQIKPDTKDRVLPLDLDDNLVGRRSSSKSIYPEIEINDPGVSHRHLKFVKQNGTFAVLELGSSNGTELNGALLEAGVYTPINVGDELVIGLWTRLKVAAR